MRKLLLTFCLLLPLPLLAVSVDFVEPVDDALQDNIRAHLAIVAAPLDCQLSDSYQKTVSKALTKAAQALGYYQSQLQSIDVPATKKCDQINVSVQVGPRIHIANVILTLLGDGEQDKVLQKLLQAFPLANGDPLNQPKYDAAKTQLFSLSQRRGYFDARYTQQQIKINVAQQTADIELTLNTGSRYRFGELQIPEQVKVQQRIREVQTFKPGDYYLADTLAEFNKNLKLTGYFQQVLARQVLSKAENHHVPIEVIVTHNPTDIFNVGGGASTDTGPRVRLKWQRPLANKYGHSMSADLFVSAPQQTLGFKYKIPLEDPLHNYLSLQTGVKAENDNDTKSESITFAVKRHWGSDDEETWKKIAFIRFELEKFRQGLEPRETTQLLIPGFTFSRHRMRGGLDLSWGDYQEYTLEGTNTGLLSDIDLVRFNIQQKWLRSIDEHRFFLRAEVGAIITNSFDQVPPSLRYFAGGDQSVRGFGFGTLSPREDGKLTGGRYLNVVSAEYSYPVSNEWRIAAFADVGNASDEPLQNLATGVGVGALWQTVIGPVRFYIARGNSEFDNTWRFHFSMGPAL
ncbi:autotransporter assembly complex family protein [Alteromonadaceae bacterium BrNp21-10]|nr:autotransporter assembly complex family protein [Alteromonadaceae bacterium BrNp21-10]